MMGLIVSVAACASKPIVAPPPKEVEGVPDTVLQPLTYLQLNAAANVFRVAFDRSLDSWQGAVDEAGLKCAISGPMAERALAALRPWLDQRAAEEATKLTDNPQSYKLPASTESCARDCSCVASLRILEAVPEDNWKKSSFKNWRKTRQRLEQLAEVESPEQVEICAESQNWICSSELYKSLVSAEPKSTTAAPAAPSGPKPTSAPKSGRTGR
ncbi:MAG TPA: hypothetical protein PLZ57_11365 [Pseudobdellovibrionaceae bacterium]|nr:hypothetical protein [Pseudobdellovibrionaceae bacterium]